MKQFFAALFGGLRPEEKSVQTIDPNTIRYTVPTISNDLAPVEQVPVPLPEGAFTLHEDDWCQVEFFPLIVASVPRGRA